MWDVAKLESVEKGQWAEPERLGRDQLGKKEAWEDGMLAVDVPRPLGDERQHSLGCTLSQLRAVERSEAKELLVMEKDALGGVSFLLPQVLEKRPVEGPA